MKLLRGLDHPFMFVVFAAMAIWGLGNIVKWGANHFNMHGLQSAVPQ